MSEGGDLGCVEALASSMTCSSLKPLNTVQKKQEGATLVQTGNLSNPINQVSDHQSQKANTSVLLKRRGELHWRGLGWWELLIYTR